MPSAPHHDALHPAFRWSLILTLISLLLTTTLSAPHCDALCSPSRCSLPLTTLVSVPYPDLSAPHPDTPCFWPWCSLRLTTGPKTIMCQLVRSRNLQHYEAKLITSHYNCSSKVIGVMAESWLPWPRRPVVFFKSNTRTVYLGPGSAAWNKA